MAPPDPAPAELREQLENLRTEMALVNQSLKHLTGRVESYQAAAGREACGLRRDHEALEARVATGEIQQALTSDRIKRISPLAAGGAAGGGLVTWAAYLLFQHLSGG